MNPELQRNLWLEFGARRLVLMTAVLGLIFFTAWLPERTLEAPAGLAAAAFVILVVFWGTRNAAQAVVGEIRDRTWDLQRLSAIEPWTMLWGKLIGSTAFVWYGGVLCLAVVGLRGLSTGGVADTILELAALTSVGLGAQTVALFASLMAVRRRQSHSRLDVAVYQIAGLLAAWSIWTAWQFVRADDLLGEGGGRIDWVLWWGIDWPASWFTLASLATFIAWAIVGSHRLLRRELMVANGPFVWLAFAGYCAAYAAGFADGADVSAHALTSARLAIAGGVVACLTYAAVLFEPKDRVTYRWLLGRLAAGRVDQALLNMQAWMYTLLGLYVIAAAFVATLPPDGLPDATRDAAASVAIAALGFVTRDVGIFLFWHLLPNSRRGDFASVTTLALLYGVLPTMFGGLVGDLSVLFYPVPTDTPSFGIAAAWAQAGLVWLVVLVRVTELRREALSAT